ncbi:hypothetical protein ABH920_006951 [Catenulispora sp. EB89]
MNAIACTAVGAGAAALGRPGVGAAGAAALTPPTNYDKL